MRERDRREGRGRRREIQGNGKAKLEGTRANGISRGNGWTKQRSERVRSAGRTSRSEGEGARPASGCQGWRGPQSDAL